MQIKKGFSAYPNGHGRILFVWIEYLPDVPLNMLGQADTRPNRFATKMGHCQPGRRQAESENRRKQKNVERIRASEWRWKLLLETLERRLRNDPCLYQIQRWVENAVYDPCHTNFARAPPAFRTFSIAGHTKGT